MTKLGLSLASRILHEGTTPTKTVAVFSGRFQPFHEGHYSIYKSLVKRFGKENTFIGTSDKRDHNTAPLSFKEKRQVMVKMFNIPPKQIVQVKSPYAPTEILHKFDETTTAFVTSVSTKDISRFRGNKYFDELQGKPELGYGSKGYYIISPEVGSVSGTLVRDLFRDPDLEDDHRKLVFKKLYGTFDQSVYDMLSSKLHVAEHVVTENELMDLITSGRLVGLLSELSTIGGTNAHVDDGPTAFLGSLEAFQNVSTERAAQIGYTVVNYIMTGEIPSAYPQYPDGPVGSVSYFPAGDYGKLTAMNQEDIYGVKAYDKWLAHVTRVATLVGYEIVYDRMQKQRDRILRSQSGKEATDSKKMIHRDTLHEILLKEGGGFGHISHPFEDMSLTFGAMAALISDSLAGNLDMVQEKLDGQNLMVTYHDGRVKVARNKTQLSDFGSNAMDISGVSSKFAGRGEIYDAFVLATIDLDAAISKLSSKQREKIFQNGHRYMNLEIIYPQTTNVIPYGLNLIVFHGVVEVDQTGKHIGGDKSAARMLDGMIRQINQDVQSVFKMSDNPTIKLPKVDNFGKEKSRLLGKLKTLQDEFNLRGSDLVLEYHRQKWQTLITAEAKKRSYLLPHGVLAGLLNRWSLQNKSAYTVADMKANIEHESFLEWALSFDKTNYADTVKKHMQPFEDLFLELGKVVMKGILDVLMVQNGDNATKSIQASVTAALRELEKSTDIATMKKVQQNLDKLTKLGGVESILPTEGIVFMYSGKLYKLTGTFAPVNMILGTLRY